MHQRSGAALPGPAFPLCLLNKNHEKSRPGNADKHFPGGFFRSITMSMGIITRLGEPAHCQTHSSFDIWVLSKIKKQIEMIIATTVARPMPFSCTGPTTMVAPERPEIMVTAVKIRFLDFV